MVEVRYRPWYRKVHGAELAHQALHILAADVGLCGRNGE